MTTPMTPEEHRQQARIRLEYAGQTRDAVVKSAWAAEAQAHALMALSLDLSARNERQRAADWPQYGNVGVKKLHLFEDAPVTGKFDGDT